MKRLFPLVFLSVFSLSLYSQTSSLKRPKLVVGVVIDQMRWDYIYRYYDKYSDGGFKRILHEGFSCENTMIPYAQTVTAAGHSCIYTGSVPAINGIMGNEWFDRSLNRSVYCTEDESVKTIGGSKDAAPQSPRNLWTTTICDELRLATNFKSKVIGIAIKDRGGILPAGHSANAAYWYDGGSGNWVTSTYYMNDLPSWTKKFNQRNIVDSLYKLGWNTLYPIESYVQSDKDDVPYEGRYPHEQKPAFPHKFDPYIGKSYGMIAATPFGNTMTFSFAKAAVENEEMGNHDATDLLALSISSPDYIGHQFGPNSIEEEDVYLRLDKDLADFLEFLDSRVGKNAYLFFLTADHGVAHVPGFLQSKKIPGEIVSLASMSAFRSVIRKFAIPNLIKSMDNYQIYLNHEAIDSAGLNLEDVRRFTVQEFNKEPQVLLAFDNEEINDANLPKNVREMFVNGYNAKRGGDVQIVLKSGDFSGLSTGTTHGSWYPYDAHIPLLWMGWNIRQGKSNKTYYMTDIAPTIAAMLHIQMPSGSIGKVMSEVIQ